jgi:hypothetical protein
LELQSWHVATTAILELAALSGSTHNRDNSDERGLALAFGCAIDPCLEARCPSWVPRPLAAAPDDHLSRSGSRTGHQQVTRGEGWTGTQSNNRPCARSADHETGGGAYADWSSGQSLFSSVGESGCAHKGTAWVVRNRGTQRGVKKLDDICGVKKLDDILSGPAVVTARSLIVAILPRRRCGMPSNCRPGGVVSKLLGSRYRFGRFQIGSSLRYCWRFATNAKPVGRHPPANHAVR